MQTLAKQVPEHASGLPEDLSALLRAADAPGALPHLPEKDV